jgi:hypothetical protein
VSTSGLTAGQRVAQPLNLQAAALTRMRDAVNRGDARAYADVYSEDAIITIFGANDLRGRDAVEQRTLLFFRFNVIGEIVSEERYLDSLTPMAQMGALPGSQPRALPVLPERARARRRSVRRTVECRRGAARAPGSGCGISKDWPTPDSIFAPSSVLGGTFWSRESGTDGRSAAWDRSRRRSGRSK